MRLALSYLSFLYNIFSKSLIILRTYTPIRLIFFLSYLNSSILFFMLNIFKYVALVYFCNCRVSSLNCCHILTVYKYYSMKVYSNYFLRRLAKILKISGFTYLNVITEHILSKSYKFCYTNLSLYLSKNLLSSSPIDFIYYCKSLKYWRFI